MHSFDPKLKGLQSTQIDVQNTVIQSDTKELHSDSEIHLNSGGLPKSSPDGMDFSVADAQSDNSEKKDDKGNEESSIVEEKGDNDSKIRSSDNVLVNVQAGAHWDIFRHEDITKLMEYVSLHREDFGNADVINDNSVSYSIFLDIIRSLVLHFFLFVAETALQYHQASRPLYDGVVFLNRHHKSRLKDEFGKCKL